LSRSLKTQLKRAILSPGMILSVIIGTYLLTSGFLLNVIMYNISVGPLSIKEASSTFLEDINSSHALGGFDLFAPILAVLPAVTFFCEDYNSGYIKSILGRVNRKRYLNEHLICSTVAGGLSIFLPTLISSAFYMVIGGPYLEENIRQGYESLYAASIFKDIQFIFGGGLIVVLLLILSFLFGAVWSNVGLCISVLHPNRYIALAFPFVLYFFLFLFCYRINALLFLSPVNMLMPDVSVITFLGYPFIYQAVWLAVVSGLFFFGAKRRLRDV